MASSHMQSQENDWLSAMPFIQYKGKKSLHLHGQDAKLNFLQVHC